MQNVTRVFFLVQFQGPERLITNEKDEVITQYSTSAMLICAHDGSPASPVMGFRHQCESITNLMMILYGGEDGESSLSPKAQPVTIERGLAQATSLV